MGLIIGPLIIIYIILGLIFLNYSAFQKEKNKLLLSLILGVLIFGLLSKFLPTREFQNGGADQLMKYLIYHIVLGQIVLWLVGKFLIYINKLYIGESILGSISIIFILNLLLILLQFIFLFI